MLIKIKWLLCFWGLLQAFEIQAQIRTSVSPEFANGLHSRYLEYIADKLGKELDLQPMPLARRIKQLEDGKLDILVGIIKRLKNKEKLIYLEPSYEKLPASFFVLKEHRHKLVEQQDLSNLIVGVTNGSEYFDRLTRLDITKVEVNSLQQKIGLLEKDRIDAFLHYRQSTLRKIKSMGLANKITVADYQPQLHVNHHFVIHKNSNLLPLKTKIEQVIKKGVSNGDFLQIRDNYYKNKL